MSAAPQPLILVVEDDAAVCTVLCTFLEDIQHRVAIANELSTGAEILENLNPTLLIVDIMLRVAMGRIW
jgi:DNA-binding response OmpR family regulator